MSEKNTIDNTTSLPDGWRKVLLGEVCEIDWGNTSLTKVIYTISGFPVYSATGQDGFTDFYENEGKAIILSAIGSYAGKVFFASGKWTAIKNTIVIKAKKNVEVDIRYIFYDVKRKNYWTLSGSGQPFITLTSALNQIIYLPSIHEQRKIAEILETVDNAIEKTDKIIEKYKRIKQGLMQDLLTRGIDENGNIRREKTHRFKDSPLGRIPEEWEIGYIADFAIINPKTKINPKEFYPFIEMDAIPIMGKKYAYLNFRQGKEAGSKFKKGDIIIARITPCAENGKALLIPNDIDYGIGSTEFIVFRAKENVYNCFLFYLIISDKVRSIAIGLMEGTSGRQRIPKYVFEKVITSSIPKSESEQKRIAEILSQIDHVIEKEEQYKQKLEHIKQGLMADLLTGKVRVNHLINGEDYVQKAR